MHLCTCAGGHVHRGTRGGWTRGCGGAVDGICQDWICPPGGFTGHRRSGCSKVCRYSVCLPTRNTYDAPKCRSGAAAMRRMAASVAASLSANRRRDRRSNGRANGRATGVQRACNAPEARERPALTARFTHEAAALRALTAVHRHRRSRNRRPDATQPALRLEALRQSCRLLKNRPRPSKTWHAANGCARRAASELCALRGVPRVWRNHIAGCGGVL